MKGFLGILLLIVFFAFACEKEEIYTKSDTKLEFSTDTVMFDTIFTNIGSATRYLTIKNPYKQSLIINSIQLAGGTTSPYRLNIDGISAHLLEDIELPAKDSIYIFVEVTIDPNNTSSPLVIKDSILFNINENQQDIKLISWGQDVHLINEEVIGNEVWTSDKPYLIYNSMLVDTNSHLQILPGTKLYFHKGSRLFVAGKLTAEGTFDEPVLFSGDRLENSYEDIPGQWDGIWFMPGSSGSVLNHVHLQNAIIGAQVDTFATADEYTLEIYNSKIENMTYAGIFAQGARMKVANTVIANCGEFAAALTIGGSYEFFHSTLANNWGISTRISPSLYLNNYYTDINGNTQLRALEKAFFGNCIIYGNKKDELIIDQADGAELNYYFDHCLIRIEEDLPAAQPDNFRSIIRNEAPNFVDSYIGNYELDTLSPAIDRGNTDIGLLYPVDLNNESRIEDEAPDLGAYERIEN